MKENIILTLCRWVIFDNIVVKYNVGDDLHYGWFKDNYGYWRQKFFLTHDVANGLLGDYTVLGHTNEDYSLEYLNKFIHPSFQ